MVATRNYAQYVKEAVKGRSGYYYFRSRTSGVPAGACGRGKDENSAYCVHCKIRYGDLQNVGSQV